MECRSCGSSLALEDEYCPFCGAKNEAAAKHIEDMRHYNREFTQTQQKVLRESKWYSRYLAVMLAIVLAAVANVAVVALEGEYYRIHDMRNRWYHYRHREETMSMLREWEADGDYARMKQYYDRTYFAGLDEANEFMAVVSAYDELEGLRLDMIQITLADVTKKRRSYNYDTGYEIEKAANHIVMLYEIFTKNTYRWCEHAYEGEHLAHLEEMEEQLELWLKAYFYFTDTDIENIPRMQKYEVLSLIDRRLSEHE